MIIAAAFPVPSPTTPIPSTILLDLCAEMVEAAADLAAQSRAALDRDEVLKKLDGLAGLIADARTEYLAAIDGR